MISVRTLPFGAHQISAWARETTLDLNAILVDSDCFGAARQSAWKCELSERRTCHARAVRETPDTENRTPGMDVADDGIKVQGTHERIEVGDQAQPVHRPISSCTRISKGRRRKRNTHLRWSRVGWRKRPIAGPSVPEWNPTAQSAAGPTQSDLSSREGR